MKIFQNHVPVESELLAHQKTAGKSGIGAIYAQVAREIVKRDNLCSEGQLTALLGTGDADFLDECIPEAKQMLMDCLDAISGALRREGLLVGSLSHRLVLEPILHGDIKDLEWESADLSSLGRLVKCLSEVKNRKVFEEEVFRYAREVDAETDITIAYAALMMYVT